MKGQDNINFNRIASAIDYIQNHFKSQPSLAEVASAINLSPDHFQRLFTEWAGVSPKKFLQYISIGYAKELLKDGNVSLFDVAYETGLSGTGRLHDLFVQIEGMTPGEFKNGGEALTIRYWFFVTPFGEVLIACTEKGICYMAFIDRPEDALADLKQLYPNARYLMESDVLQEEALSIFSLDWNQPACVKLHLKATPFQLKVWETLLKIPLGRLVTYGTVAGSLGCPDASRAVGTAVGDNPVAFLIPCHRVIRSTGLLGGYRWGLPRKSAIIGWEAAHIADQK